MLSVRNLFEATQYAAPAQSPMAGPHEYVLSRMAALKKQFSLGRMKALDFTQQMNELKTNLRNKQMGVTQF